MKRLSLGAAVGLLVACTPGSFDLSFGGTGTVSLGDTAGSAPSVAALGFDRSVVSTGRTSQQLAHITDKGQVDAWGAAVPATIVSGVSVVGNVAVNGVGNGILVSGLDAEAHARVMRFASDGSLDPTFGDGGIVTLEDTTSNVDPTVEETVNSFVVTPVGTGSLGFLGFLGVTRRPAPQSEAYVDVVRLSSTGEELSRQRVLLPMVGLGGYSRTTATSAVRTADQGAVVALNAEWVDVYRPETYPGHPFRWSWLARFRVDGTLDTSYGADGFQGVPKPPQIVDGSAYSTLIRQVAPIGGSRCTGSSCVSGCMAAVGVLNYVLPPPAPQQSSLGSFISVHCDDGQPDTFFNGTGYVYALSTTGATWFEPSTVSIGAALNMLVGGTLHKPGTNVGVLASYRLNGALDTSWGDGGFLSVPGVPTSLSHRDSGTLYVGALLAGSGPAVSRLFVPGGISHGL